MTNEHDMPTGPLTSTDDPRVLAYLLGELDAADVAHVESYLADTPGADAELDELRAVLGILESEIATDAASPKLHDGQRDEIAAAAASTTESHSGASTFWLRMAASVFATAGLAWLAVQVLDEPPHASAPTDTTVVKGEPMSIERIRALRDGDREAYLQSLGYAKGELAKKPEGLEALETLGYLGGGTSTDRDDELSAEMLRELIALGYTGGGGGGTAGGAPPAEESFGSVSDSDEAWQEARRRDQNTQGGLGKMGVRGRTRSESTAEEVTKAVDETSVDAAFDSTGLNDAIGIAGRSPGSRNLGRRGGRAQSDDAPLVLNDSAPTTTPAAPGNASENLGALSGRGRVMPPDRERLEDLGYVDADDDRDIRHFTPPRDVRAEGFAPVPENPFVSPRDPQHALSTFGLDVDTASYAYMRRMLNEGRLPPPASIRLEELINTFDYDDAWAQEVLAEGDAPIALRVDGGWCPWNGDHRLVRLSMQAVEPDAGERPPANLVFLIDVSGSMKADDRLPLLKSAMRLLVGTLRADDRVAIVTYNDSAGVTLESTSCDRKDVILAALDGLRAGGSTNGEAGLRRAYQVASQHFVDGGVNRVILASDGDFNVGAQSRDELYGLITQQATSGVFLTVLGFGTGNLKDSNLELLADRGNGNYAYIDTLAEGEKVLVEEAGSTLQTVAKDVKIQVEFNPAKVAAYRLLGYENRALAARDFNDDRKDAGDVGAGHTVTALYEVIPAGVEWQPQVDELKYQSNAKPAEPDVELTDSPEMLTVKLRYKQPDADTSELMVVPYEDRPLMIHVLPGQAFPGMDLDDDMRFASAVTAFGMLMRGSEHAGAADFEMVIDMAERSRGDDPRGYRAEFVRLVKMAKGLAGR